MQLYSPKTVYLKQKGYISLHYDIDHITDIIFQGQFETMKFDKIIKTSKTALHELNDVEKANIKP